MAKYSVIYRDAGSPQPKQATLESFGESYLRTECEGKGWQVLLIRQTDDVGLWGRINRMLTSGKIQLRIRLSVSTAELCMFCEVMRALYMAGVPMLEVIQMCIEETGNPWFKKRLLIVQDRLRGGDGLSTAMADPRCVKAFPILMRETVRIGEANGRLGDSLERLITTFKRAVETKRETVSAMIYPAIAMIVFFVVGAVISMKIPPLLKECAGKDIDKIYNQLPGAIRLLFYIYNHPVCLIYPPLIIIGLIVLWRLGMKYHATRVALTKFQRRVWMIGPLLYQFALVRFLDMLAANHETGIQISDSLELIRGTVDDALIEDSLERIHFQIVTKGLGLATAITLPREVDVYPGLVRQMIRAGEESGKLAEMLRPIVDFYENQAKALLKRTMDLMTPAMIILLGAMIGPVVIGVYKTLIILSKAAAS